MDIVTYRNENGDPVMIYEDQIAGIFVELDDIDIEIVDGKDEEKSHMVIRKKDGVTLTIAMTKKASHVFMRELINVDRVLHGKNVVDIDKWMENMLRGDNE